MSKTTTSNSDGAFELTFPNISHLKGLLDHLKATNENEGNFVLTKDSITYQSSGFGNKLLNDISLDISTFPYKYMYDGDELVVGIEVQAFKNQLNSPQKNSQVNIKKEAGSDYVKITPYSSSHMRSTGNSSQIKLKSIDYDIVEVPEYDKSPLCIVTTNEMAKNLVNLCTGSKNPTMSIVCGSSGIRFQSRHNFDIAVNTYTIGEVSDDNAADVYTVSHHIIKALGKLASINKEKPCRIFYKKGLPLRISVPISDDNGLLNVYIAMEPEESKITDYAEDEEYTEDEEEYEEED